ncbi:GTP pyrophosphokinase [Lactobacillus hominis]|uniref:GTP pyrophosphokinase n=1 Tax=Lactobacillus hominis TaxID=1203033 RepID=UPI00262C1543|nr:hypothetical protein [Lactobacillus hominis]
MMNLNIYEKYEPTLHQILDDFTTQLVNLNKSYQENYHESLFEHLNERIKTQKSIIEKCQRKNLPVTPYSALRENRDSIGVRIVCNFIDDIYTCINLIEKMSDIEIVTKKDYITNAKPNDYRSYHFIIFFPNFIF